VEEEPLPEVTEPCGGGIPKASGGQWQCTFADEFAGTSLDRTKWSVMTTALSGFTHAGECFVDDPSTVSVNGGHLTLTSRKLAAPTSCGGLYDAQYQSGMVFTRDFAQAYGRFEARLRFPAGRGLASSWWMWPKEMAYGAKSGEIDIAEHFGAYPDIVSPYVHMLDDGRTRDYGKGAYCNVADPDGRFHTYAVEWLPGEMRFLFDGVTCMTFSNWDAVDPLTNPQPFDQPFFLVLTLAHGWGENAVGADTPFPADFAIDYVRAWA
jgi:beta-glucanase (GH16 family)